MSEIENGRDERLDDTDRSLLEALQDDGRLGYAELGELVGLTAGGARRRVMRLQERGILQIIGVTDPLKLGYNSMALLGITCDQDVLVVADALGEIEDVVYVVVVGAGSFDLLVEVTAEDPSRLFEITRTIKTVPGVVRAETFSYHQIHTHRFTWGSR